MPDLAMEGLHGDILLEPSEPYIPSKEIFTERSPRSPLSTCSPESGSIDLTMVGGVDTSIDHLYHNIYEMLSSDQSPSRLSYLSYGEESRIDSELRFYAGGGFVELEVTKEVVVENTEGGNVPKTPNGSKNKKFAQSMRLTHLALGSEANVQLSPKSKSFSRKTSY